MSGHIAHSFELPPPPSPATLPMARSVHCSTEARYTSSSECNGMLKHIALPRCVFICYSQFLLNKKSFPILSAPNTPVGRPQPRQGSPGTL